MSESRAGRWILGCAIAAGVSLVLCCGCGAVGSMFAPELLLQMVTSEEPLPVPVAHADEARQEAIRARIDQDLAATGTTRISGEELTALLASDIPVQVLVAPDGRATFDVSAPMEQQGGWLNVHVAGRFALEHGWFTTLTIDEAQVGDWEFGSMIRGQELAMNANQSLAQQRAKDPTLDALFAGAERVTLDGGALEVTLTEDGVRTWQEGSP